MITDDRAIKFSNEKLRPYAELMRKCHHEFETVIAEWNGGINALFPNETDNIIDDGRTSENPLSGADANSLITRMMSIMSAIDDTAEMVVINKACVRKLEVN